jgi:hypothetical protein
VCSWKTCSLPKNPKHPLHARPCTSVLPKHGMTKHCSAPLRSPKHYSVA